MRFLMYEVHAVPALLLAGVLGIVAFAGTEEAPDEVVTYTVQDDPLQHTNQDGAVLREIALIYISLNNLESLGLVDPGTSEMFALAADLGTECADLALSVCGQGKVCWLCVDWDGDNGGNCSFGCDTGGGCVPAPPCGSTSSMVVL